MNLIKTHLLLAENNEAQVLEPKSLPIYSGEHTGLGNFWEGANLMGILNTIGGTWSQIEKARNGQPVYIKQANGEVKNMTPTIQANLDQLAKRQNTTEDKLVQMLELQQKQLEKQASTPVKKNNNLLYIGAASVLTLLLVGGIYVATKK